MEIFTRDLVLFGPPAETRQWAVDIAQRFADLTGRTPATWQSIVGGSPGHVSWTMQVDGTADLMAVSTTALSDQAYLDTIEAGRPYFTGPAEDRLYRSFVPLPPDTTRAGNVAMVTKAVARASKLGDAIGWGLEVAHHVSTLTGTPMYMLGTQGGQFSELLWMGFGRDAAHGDELTRRINADDGYLKLIARGGELFVDGSGRQEVFVRIA